MWVQTSSGVAIAASSSRNWAPDYADPNGFFELFNGRSDGSGWSDPEFRQLLDSANADGRHAARMRKLAACEERLLRAMPVLPLFFDSYAYLQKPYVKGMQAQRSRYCRTYKDVWIDTNWKPS